MIVSAPSSARVLESFRKNILTRKIQNDDIN